MTNATKVVVFHDTKYCCNAFIKTPSWSIYSLNNLDTVDILVDYNKAKNRMAFILYYFNL